MSPCNLFASAGQCAENQKETRRISAFHAGKAFRVAFLRRHAVFLTPGIFSVKWF